MKLTLPRSGDNLIGFPNWIKNDKLKIIKVNKYEMGVDHFVDYYFNKSISCRWFYSWTLRYKTKVERNKSIFEKFWPKIKKLIIL